RRRPTILPLGRRHGRHGALGAPPRVRRNDMLNVPRSIFLRPVLFSLAGLAWGFAAHAVTPFRVADINPGFRSEGSGPRGFLSLGGRVLFVGLNESLWATSGVPGDPVRLGPADLEDVFFPRRAGNRAYFSGCQDSACG